MVGAQPGVLSCLTQASPDPEDDIACDIVVTVAGQTVSCIHAKVLMSLGESVGRITCHDLHQGFAAWFSHPVEAEFLIWKMQSYLQFTK